MQKISAIESLSGALSTQESLRGSLSVSDALSGSLSTDDVSERYEGPYSIVPDAKHDIVLNTTDKKMISDMTVEKIPCRINDNLSDGLTVYIGN